MAMIVDPSWLQILWFILIAVLWIGFLVLEGFDFGVGMLIPVLGKDEKRRRVLVNTIGPVWDGNEVWLLTAGGATFAAFPGWYATLFSGAYIPLLLILVGLIVRGVSFEYRAKRPETRWRSMFDWFACIGSFVVSLVLGIAFGNFVIGMPVTLADNGLTHVYAGGGLLSWFHPFALLFGVALVAVNLFHGAIYLALKTRDEVHEEAKAFAVKIGLVAIVGGAALLLWQNLAYGTGIVGWILMVVAAVGLVFSWLMIRSGRDFLAFLGTAVAILAVACGVFWRMFPDLGFDNSLVQDQPLNIVTASATPMTLEIMSWAALIFVPIVLAYQTWSYYVFRMRLGTHHIPDEELVESAKKA
jgi:cytochrome d ubiquinol oxidase subunit II